MGIKLKDTNVEELKSTKIYMLGRLANEDEFETPIYSDLNNIKFTVVPLCKEAEPIEEINGFLPNGDKISSYIGFDTNLKRYLPLEYKYSSYSKKIEIIEQILKDKIIVFRTEITLKEEKDKNVNNDGYRDYKVFKNISVEYLLDNTEYNVNKFIRIPNINIKETDFISKLRSNDYIELTEYPTYLEYPKYIRCNKHIYYFERLDWITHSSNKSMWSYNGNIDNIMVLELNDDHMDNKIIRCSNYTFLIDEEIINNPLKISTIKDIIENEDMNEVNCQHIEKEHPYYYQKQLDFLKGLHLFCKSKGLAYKYDDIVNLHISIKTNFITIISGMTGTGKSQLAWSYAKMLDASLENQNLLFVPINPNYIEPSDLLGYYNYNVGMYIPADVGLVDFLVKAYKNPNKMFLIIFDEMNLAQVEHWFAPFISLLEADENNRFLKLYSANNRCINDEKYPCNIKIGNNIRIIGTINLDETVKEFSDRLLDRANVINLKKLKFSDLSNAINNDIEDDLYEKYICADVDEFKRWEVDYNTIEILKDKLIFFDELHDIISAYDEKKGISFRVLNSIAAYIANIPINENGEQIISKSYALDLQVKQRIISKLKGTKRIIGNLVGEYDEKSDTINGSKILEFLEREDIANISNFNNTKEYIKQKSKELSLYGYTY